MNLRFLLIPLAASLGLAVACDSENTLTDRDNGETIPTDGEEDVTVEGPQPDIQLEPEILGFGWRKPGCASAPKEFVIRNVGDQDLDIYDVQLAGNAAGSYAINVPSASVLAPLEEVTVSVTFTPTNIGVANARVEVKSNDPDESTASTKVEGEGSETTIGEDIFVQAQPEGVDIVWVVDNSGSMGDVVQYLGQKFQLFIDTFVNLGLDYQLAVVTTDTTSPDQSGRLQGVGVMSKAILGSDQAVAQAFIDATTLGTGGSGDERGFEAAQLALNDPLISTENAGLVRPGNESLAIIVVSDEADGSSVSASAFASWLDAYKGDPQKTSFSSVSGPASGLTPCGMGSIGFGGSPITAQPAPKYAEAAQLTGGLHASLCDLDSAGFNDVITYLSYYAAGLGADFQLNEPADASKLPLFKVTVNGVEVPYSPISGWTYNPQTNSIEFSNSMVPGPGEEVHVTYPSLSACN